MQKNVADSRRARRPNRATVLANIHWHAAAYLARFEGEVRADGATTPREVALAAIAEMNRRARRRAGWADDALEEAIVAALEAREPKARVIDIFTREVR